MWEFIINQLHTNQFFSAGLVVSVLGGTAFYLKGLPKIGIDKIKNKFLFTATIYQTDPLYDDFEAWFFNRYKDKYKNVEAISREQGNYGGSYLPETIKSEQNRKVYYKQIEGVFFIKHKGRLIFIKKGRDKLEHTNDIRGLYMNQYHISCINGSKIVKELLEECIVFNSKKDNDLLKIYTHDSYGNWFMSGRISSKDINSVVLPTKLKNSLMNDINEFTSSKDWYKEASIFYKRGHLYHGSPGNGKTSLSLAIASTMNRDLYCIDLNSLSENTALKTAFGSISSNAVLLIEDIDGFYNLREPVKKDSKLSFSTLLNCLDGAFYKEGLFTIITTNKIDAVDPALKRKGRMDLVLEIPQPEIAEVNQYLTVFYGKEFGISGYTHNYSMCEIQEICLKNKNTPEIAIAELELS